MRAMVVIFSILLWASPSLAEQQSPDGFGPIKFGMTKEEAWEAVGGEGEWKDDILVHQVGLPKLMTDFFEVRQHFVQDSADRVTIQNFDQNLGSDECVLMLVNVIAALINKYGVQPINIEYRSDSYPENHIKDIIMHVFNYSNGSMIATTIITKFEFSIKSIEEVSCLFAVEYIPPTDRQAEGF